MACDKLWAHFAEMGIDSVDTPHDYYWSIPYQDLYRLESQPTTFEVGQLSEDWQGVQRMLEADRDVITFDFVKISAILRELGLQVMS
jgi:hypothetical protein